MADLGGSGGGWEEGCGMTAASILLPPRSSTSPGHATVSPSRRLFRASFSAADFASLMDELEPLRFDMISRSAASVVARAPSFFIAVQRQNNGALSLGTCN